MKFICLHLYILHQSDTEQTLKNFTITLSYIMLSILLSLNRKILIFSLILLSQYSNVFFSLLILQRKYLLYNLKTSFTTVSVTKRAVSIFEQRELDFLSA